MSFHEPGVAAVKDDEGAYHITLKCKPLYKQRFLKTFGYYDNIAAVKDGEGYFHINLKGFPIYNKKFEWVGNYQENRCVVRDFENNYFHIKKDGNCAYQQKYNYVGDFKYGIAVVYTKEGFARHINRNGDFIHNNKFSELGVFHKGYAIARDTKGYFHIDKEGNPIYKERYKWIEPYYNDRALVSNFQDELLTINNSGEIIDNIRDDASKTTQELQRNHLMDMLVGYWKTQIIYSIVKLGILELIQNGYNTFNKLDSKLKIPKESLGLIINILKVWKFISDNGNSYSLNYFGKLLTEGDPKPLKYAALMWGSEHYHTMGRLIDALKEYKPQFKKVYNKPLFEYFNSNKERAMLYLKALKEYSTDYEELIKYCDFSKSKIILDVGGGHGSLLVKILERNNQIEKGIILDLPEITQQAKPLIMNESIRSKLEFFPSNFFDPIPFKVDTILMSRVLHDWSDQEAIELLKNIRNSLMDNGKLILLETIIPKNPTEDKGISLNFNLLVTVGGKERNEIQIKKILNKSNFEIEEIKAKDNLISIIIAK
ncbi:MAG: methyltransferase [Candidatus Lokiarchaeota archaeon]